MIYIFQMRIVIIEIEIKFFSCIIAFQKRCYIKFFIFSERDLVSISILIWCALQKYIKSLYIAQYK